MILRLQHQRPDGEIDTYHLKPGRRYHIGRGSACEVRILDLKLSRKHCALEFEHSRWQVVDLLSTNGCTLNGEQIVGTIPVAENDRIEAGQTLLTVAAFELAEGELSASPHSAAAHADHDHDPATKEVAPKKPLATPSESSSRIAAINVEQEPLPDGPHSAEESAEATPQNAWEPEPGSEAHTKTDALIPNKGTTPRPVPVVRREPAPFLTPTAQRRHGSAEPRKPTAVFRADDQRNDDHDVMQTQQHDPATVEPANAPQTMPGTDSAERTFYITVLGRRVGPLTRSAARELKARELKGTLSVADLEQYPLG